MAMNDAAPALPSGGDGLALRAAGPSVFFVVSLVTVCVGSMLALVFWDYFVPAFSNGCNEIAGALLSQEQCARGSLKIRTYALAFALFPLIVLLERLRPAVPHQAAVSPGLMVDCMWFLAFPILGIWLPTAFEELLQGTFGPPLAGLTYDGFSSWPVGLQVLFAIVLSDFLTWLSHLIRHKVPWFWEFHKIHHSQLDLNYFTTVRLHPLDLFANSLIRFLPFLLLDTNLTLPAFLIWVTFLRLYEMFVHSNIRTDLGPLRYLLVTPQSHRVHHSNRWEHIDRNFGNFLSIWDFTFRTQCLDFNTYPETGVHDPNCPRSRAITIPAALRTLGAELVYPLRAIIGGQRSR